jgi:hypothetical protein
MKTTLNRRQFLSSGAASAAAITILPAHVLGGAGQVAPNEKITLAYIGCGTQGLREMLEILSLPEVEIVAVCDPVKDASNYVDWSKDDLRASIGKAIGNPDWRREQPGIHGGREVAKEIIEAAYARKRGVEKYSGCKTYSDFRELLDQEKDITAVKIMTPDHLHATIAIAAMKKGKQVLMHKPLANRVQEARLVIDVARQTKVTTHFLPASPGDAARTVAGWIEEGAIGKLREIHNWSNRPMWPQYATLPKDRPPVPAGFDWDLWLGPSLDRPYHPHYTHAVFRGWYEFGGGAVADMGHYSLWPIFQAFQLDAPILVESRPSHVCVLENQVSITVRNDYSFPIASTIRFKFAAKGARPAIDLFWYDGGMKPPTPDELEEDNQEFEPEGMMFVGEQGKILAGFRGEEPRLIPKRRSREFWAAKGKPEPIGLNRGRAFGMRTSAWVKAFKEAKPSYGDFLLAGPISEAFNLGAISLRLGGKRLVWDAEQCKVTNLPEANKYLSREYRKGWELQA